MDLWDLTRLLFRRWYIALPILLTSVIVAGLAGKSVEPDYRATGNVTMIPAPGPAESPSKTTVNRPKNPWLDLGYAALGNAAMIKVVDKKTLNSLVQQGLSDSLTVTMDERSPLLKIEATADTPDKATATVRAVIKLLAAEIERQQKQFNVQPEDTITTLTLNDGGDVETVTSKVKRVLIVIVGLGLLLTAGGTIGIDALLRWRARRKAGPDENDRGQHDPAPTARARAGMVNGQPPGRPGYVDPLPGSGIHSDDATSTIPVARMPVENGHEPVGELYGLDSSEDIVQLINDAKLGSSSGDETVVLPSPAGRRRRDQRSGGR